MNVQTILQGDCLEVMKTFPDKSFDLVLTDPPYGIGAANTELQGNQRGNSKSQRRVYNEDWDKNAPSREYFDEIFRVSKNQIIFGGNFFSLPPSPCWLVWDKENGNNGYADCELAWTSLMGAVRRLKYRWAGMLQENMKNKEYRHHPTQKPVPLMNWALSFQEGSILDPFMGSGTTLVAAKYLNRNATGIEISEKYCEIARMRLRQEVLF